MESETFEHSGKPTQTTGKKVTGIALDELRSQQQSRCFYTGEELTLENVSLDHLQPLSKGGTHTMDNVVLCTKEVNTLKGMLTAGEFIRLCKLVTDNR